jgi:ubiquitin carboxyl-terminal hydrolase 48
VQEEFSLPTICQRLFLRGDELEDDSATVEYLKIFANDTLDLRVSEEVVDLTSDGDEPSRKKKREGNGFSGTLLGNAEVPWSSPAHTPYRSELEKQCFTCTFSNPSDVLSCQICDTQFP